MPCFAHGWTPGSGQTSSLPPISDHAVGGVWASSHLLDAGVGRLRRDRRLPCPRLGRDTWDEAWGFNTDSTVPLPVGAAQLALAWLAARNVRPPVGLIAAVLLSAFCLISLMAGMFDGDLINNVSSDGLISSRVVWGVVLLLVTAAVGLLAAVRARQLYRLR